MLTERKVHALKNSASSVDRVSISLDPAKQIKVKKMPNSATLTINHATVDRNYE